MADLNTYVLTLIIEKMSQQKADLRELRSRASYILTSAGVINGAFIATYSAGTSKRIFELGAIILYSLAAVVTSFTFISREKWIFTSIIDQMYSNFKGYDEEKWIQITAQSAENRWDANNQKMDLMTRFMNLGLLLFAISLASWIFTI